MVVALEARGQGNGRWAGCVVERSAVQDASPLTSSFAPSETQARGREGARCAAKSSDGPASVSRRAAVIFATWADCLGAGLLRGQSGLISAISGTGSVAIHHIDYSTGAQLSAL